MVVDEAPAPMKNEDDDWSWRRLELGRFTVRGVDVVGCGAHCVVRKDETGTVAVKYYGGADAAERLAREVRRLKQLDENRIVAYGNDEGRCLLARHCTRTRSRITSVGCAPEPRRRGPWPASCETLRKRWPTPTH